MLTLRLLLLSGPARSGKNVAGAAIGNKYGADHFALSDQLKIDTHAYYGLGSELSAMHFEDRKDTACLEFSGLTPRQAYIDYSENYLKPRFGSGQLGELAVPRIRRNIEEGRLSILSGVGFFDEVRPIVETALSENCLHLIVVGEAKTNAAIFDSRERLNLNALGVPSFEIKNDRTKSFIDDVCAIIGNFEAARQNFPQA
ncbi:MAG: hypothetical protein OXI01_02805 [Albidovulum sp.]|nr:hypothetical protein [Albidovulum sp.]